MLKYNQGFSTLTLDMESWIKSLNKKNGFLLWVKIEEVEAKGYLTSNESYL